jgi:hypothetical protein
MRFSSPALLPALLVGHQFSRNRLILSRKTLFLLHGNVVRDHAVALTQLKFSLREAKPAGAWYLATDSK